MQLKKLERLALALIEVLADREIDLALRQELRETYDKVERSICLIEGARQASQQPCPPADSHEC